MASLWNKILREAKNVSLTKEERDFILSKVSAHVYHKAPLIDTDKKQIKSPYTYHFRFGLSWHEKRFVPLAVVLILIIFGGTSFAANYALPGEALYSMKVNVNEEVESWIALSPDANARFEAVRAERRLKEAEKLTIKKKQMTPKAKAQIKENFAKNAKNAKAKVAEIEASGEADKAAQIKEDFGHKLEAHSVVLSKLASDEVKLIDIDDASKEDVKEISALVDEHIVKLKNMQNSSETVEVINESEAEKESKSVEVKEEVKVQTEEGEKKNETEETAESDPAAALMMVTEMVAETEVAEPKAEARKANTEPAKETARKTKEVENKTKEISPKVKTEVNNILKELNLPVEEE